MRRSDDLSNLRKRQTELLRKLAEAQEAVPEGQPIDFLTSSSFDGIAIILPTGESFPLNRHDLDELIDRGLVRVTLTREYGDINGHVTNDGFEFVQTQNDEVDKDHPRFVDGQPLFDGPQDVPTAFISYSHDSDEHKRWVRVGLAERLMAAGVRVILDQWQLKFGADLTYFMEQALRAEHILVVCTPGYAERANERRGGVGYEASIITAELLARRPSVEPKVVPILRGGNLDSARPTFLRTALAADLRPNNLHYEEEFKRLLRQLHREPEFVPPPLGEKPDFVR